MKDRYFTPTLDEYFLCHHQALGRLDGHVLKAQLIPVQAQVLDFGVAASTHHLAETGGVEF